VFIHDIRLALRSLRRNPFLSALMIGTIAVGIAASMIAITLYHARRSSHPLEERHTICGDARPAR
jgi:putative ABC transport system permease protein